MPRIIPTSSTGGTKRITASWCSGKEVVGADTMFRGWFIDAGIDQGLDDAALLAGWRIGALLHLDGQSREHWLLPSPTMLYVLIDGLPYDNLTGLSRNDVAYAGIGCSWVKGQRSRLAVMALVADLLAVGHTTPIPFTTSSTSTGDLLWALLHQNDILNAMERAAEDAGKPRSFEFCEVGMPTVAGPKVARGSGNLTTMISPITSAHPAGIDTDMLRTVVKTALAPSSVPGIKDEHWASIVAWATDYKAAALKAANPAAEPDDLKAVGW